jgi:hypothetical protein
VEAQNDSGDFDLLDQELLQFLNEDFEFENNSLTFTQLMQIPSQQLVIDEKPKPQTSNFYNTKKKKRKISLLNVLHVLF